MGNSAGDRFSLRHGNHDVYRESLSEWGAGACPIHEHRDVARPHRCARLGQAPDPRERAAPPGSRASAREIGHLSQIGPDGVLEWPERLPSSTREILIHAHNNPILDSDSVKCAELFHRGIDLAWDSMEIVLETERGCARAADAGA
jgi:hypothetical protein